MNTMRLGITHLKQLAPIRLRRSYWRLKAGIGRLSSVFNKPPIREIDLQRTLMGGEGEDDAGHWAEITSDLQRASLLLKDSAHVRFLEQYRALGEKLLICKNFEETPYFKNAAQCVRVRGDYFGRRSREGILEQARLFATLYERMRDGDPSELTFPFAREHSPPQSPPLVRKTLTPNTFQIIDGHHRLAIAWVLGQRKTKAAVPRLPMPTALQSLVLAVNQTKGRKELYQPIDSPEFDSSWGLVRRCDDRLAMMLKFLATSGHDLSGLSVIDLACSYGWFVHEFSKRGCCALGVDMDPMALKVGQIAYGIPSAQLVQSDLLTFLYSCNRPFDVVVLLSVLHHFALKPDFGSPEDVLKRIDALTGHCLFLDTGHNHEQWFHRSLPEWDDNFVIGFIKQHTSFTEVLPLGRDSDSIDPYSDNYGRTLFVCIRS